MNRSSTKGKRKVETKKARVKRRAVPERMRSERRVEEVNCGTNGSQADGAVALATNAAPKMIDQSGRSDFPQRPDTLAGTTSIYPQATVTALAALQAWFLLPLRNWQSWQGAWFRLLPR
jgi:hypothetical protein